MQVGRRRRLKIALRSAAALAVATAALNARAAPAAGSVTLVEAVSAAPADRAALRSDLVAVQAKRLQAWRAAGVLSSYELFFNRYADAGTWDGMEVLTFADATALARWNRIERSAPAGLDAAAAALAKTIATAPADRVRAEATPGAPQDGPTLVIPYEVLVPVGDYLHYFDGYTIPQLRGWMADGALAGYELHLARYYAGRPWTALLVLRYRDEDALNRREAVVEKVRAALAADPAWKAFSDNKQQTRAEKQLAVADRLAAEGAP